MPKSKRAKVVHLSKTQKKGKALSRKHFDDLQAAAQKYRYVFVFEVDNMRNNHFKEVRKEFADSRLVKFLYHTNREEEEKEGKRKELRKITLGL